MTDANGNEISCNGDINRQSESPARTIDSHDSTTGSMDTIVDRSTHNTATTTANNNNNNKEMMQSTINQSTNTTNMQQQHNSLTNSEIAMLQQQNQSGSDDELMLKHQQMQQHNQQQQQMQKQMQPKPMDAQSHIYSSPVYDEKPMQPLKLTAAALLETSKIKDLEKPKLISHEEFKQQLEETIASRAATLDSRISKKQRFPPELIKDDGSSTKSLRSLNNKKRSTSKRSTDCCSAFPVQIVLGLLQLLLAITLVALGSLLIVRDASLSTAGCGIWTGLIAAVTGSLGVVGLRKTQTSFLALSLVCVATSTLALAISGVGLSRDINRSKEQFNLLNSNSEISAASSLIFTLFLHFIVSILSVYRCALQIYSRSKTSDLQDIIIKTSANGLPLHADTVDHYVKAMSVAGSDKDKSEKMAAFWMYAAQTGNMITPQAKMTTSGRPVMLIPATGNLSPPPTMMMPPQPPIMGPTSMAAYRGMTLPYMRSSMPILYAPPPNSIPGTYRPHRSCKSNDARKKRRAAAQALRCGKSNADRRQRHKSNADVVDGNNPSFQYHGLDRAIADNFLARQEQSNVGSHLDYSSSSGASDTCANTAASRASSKTKIVCRDVVM